MENAGYHAMENVGYEGMGNMGCHGMENMQCYGMEKKWVLWDGESRRHEMKNLGYHRVQP